MASLLYGSGLRLLECLRLRVHRFERRQIVVRGGKGGEDRVTVLPDPVTEPLKRHVEQVRFIHKADTPEGGFRTLSEGPLRPQIEHGAGLLSADAEGRT